MGILVIGHWEIIIQLSFNCHSVERQKKMGKGKENVLSFSGQPVEISGELICQLRQDVKPVCYHAAISMPSCRTISINGDESSFKNFFSPTAIGSIL
jgi:hypothetical protein